MNLLLFALVYILMDGSQTALNVLHHMEAVRRVGKQGKLYLYETVKTRIHDD